MKLLLHTCCAPCLIYPKKVLEERDFEVVSFFYNPNIHPYTEYKKRLDSLKEYAQISKVKLYTTPDYDIESFFGAVGGKIEEPDRCIACWRLRLGKSAKKARELGIDVFTTTLLVSPYQNKKLIKKAGEQAAEEEGVKFYYQDFSDGFREAYNEARNSGLYLQKYCGCLFSERARYLKKYRKINEKI
ncbi:MAG: epoxyqueuosine reductase QueH [Candidatus Omnitrophica bacterium]|nr:epoxyqueuosine reductase QueH [Candidatus Omnitrophota bacterium]